MTKNKDFKALVRARMRRTGQSYTAARAALQALPSRSSEPLPSGTSEQALRAAHRQRLLIDRWFVDGRLRSIPARRKVRAAVLLEVLTRFVPGRRYPEQEVSRLLERIHPDFATLRRELVGLHYLQRRAGVYRVCSSAPIRSDHQRHELPAWEEIWLPGFIAGVGVTSTGAEAC